LYWHDVLAVSNACSALKAAIAQIFRAASGEESGLVATTPVRTLIDLTDHFSNNYCKTPAIYISGNKDGGRKYSLIFRRYS
jgi:hypothetical protein